MFKVSSITKRSALVAGLTSALIAAALGCGTASNNDQGTSFLALGFFSGAATGTTAPAGDSGTVVPLANDSAIFGVELPNDASLRSDGLYVTSYIGLQNRLATQYIITESVECEYSIPGASISIPGGVFALGTVVGPDPTLAPTIPGVPTTPTTGTGTGTGTTTGRATIASTSYSQVFVVGPETFAYLNSNRNALPALPFMMTASCRGVGRTQAGDRLETNYVNFAVQFVELAECCTGGTTPTDPGFSEGPGTGGDVEGSTGSTSGA